MMDLTNEENQKTYELRAHIYQARGLPAAAGAGYGSREEEAEQGAAWGTLGGAGERGTAHSPGADHADRADWCASSGLFLRSWIRCSC